MDDRKVGETPVMCIFYHIYLDAIGRPPVHPWEKWNINESLSVRGSIYAELLTQCRVDLYNSLQLGCIWPHLRQLGVLRQRDEERLKVRHLVNTKWKVLSKNVYEFSFQVQCSFYGHANMTKYSIYIAEY